MESHKTSDLERTKLPSQIHTSLMFWLHLGEFQIVPSTSMPCVSIGYSQLLVGKTHKSERSGKLYKGGPVGSEVARIAGEAPRGSMM